MINVILCGGAGTRLWPLSRKYFPKQFYKFFGNESLFQKTVLRNDGPCAGRMIVTGEDLYFIAMDQAGELALGEKQQTVLLEPVGRNTAPAIALACMDLPPDETVLVTPSDHLILDEKKYLETVSAGREAAEKGLLVTFGIKPTYPETGYGYIEGGSAIHEEKGIDVLKVTAFREKPEKAMAEEYVRSGNYFWNSGMFVFRAGVFLEELKTRSPEIYTTARKAHERIKRDGVLARIERELMEAIPAMSIDHAVMEKSDRVAVIPADIGWNDLGSFDSLYDVLPRDGDNNTVSANSVVLNGSNNLIINSGRTVAAFDVNDLIIVDTDDAVLVGRRGSSQMIKGLLDSIKARDVTGGKLADFHRTVYRPWGNFTVLFEYEKSCVKKIVVHPGKRLSLQKHMHRSEHWVVVEGEAVVTLGTTDRAVPAGESIFIPREELHRVENKGKGDLVIMEVQIGDKLDEDDIIRVEDDFGRAG